MSLVSIPRVAVSRGRYSGLSGSSEITRSWRAAATFSSSVRVCTCRALRTWIATNTLGAYSGLSGTEITRVFPASGTTRAS